MAEYEIREAYEILYRRLKSEGVNHLERSRIPEHLREEILEIIKKLPHPSVASVFDIEDVCNQCIAGKLENLYGLLGQDAQELRNRIREAYPSERVEGLPLPPNITQEGGSIQDVSRMVKWSNEAILRSFLLLRGVAQASDIVLKAQCPYCMGDLVEVVVGNELRLRCKGQCKPACRNVDWHLSNVTKRSPP